MREPGRNDMIADPMLHSLGDPLGIEGGECEVDGGALRVAMSGAIAGAWINPGGLTLVTAPIG